MPFQERGKRIDFIWLALICNSPYYRRVEKLTIIVKLIAVVWQSYTHIMQKKKPKGVGGGIKGGVPGGLGSHLETGEIPTGHSH